jgi:FtsZ-interacting cell division protein YlmF
MREKFRGFLGFLGLIEDEYGEYGATGPVRPFSDEPAGQDELDWASPAPSAQRQFPTSPGGPSTSRAPQAPPNRVSSISVLDSSGQGPRVRPMPSGVAPRGISSFSQERDVAIFAPRSYDESRRITDLLRSNRAVVLNVSSVEPSLGRRLVDFAAGTAYALSAKIEVLGRNVYLVSPQGMHLGPEAKDRLRATNYRDSSDV